MIAIATDTNGMKKKDERKAGGYAVLVKPDATVNNLTQCGVEGESLFFVCNITWSADVTVLLNSFVLFHAESMTCDKHDHSNIKVSASNLLTDLYVHLTKIPKIINSLLTISNEVLNLINFNCTVSFTNLLHKGGLMISQSYSDVHGWLIQGC